MATWIKMPLGREVGLDPGDIVLDGDPATPPPQRGHSSQFSAHVCCRQTAGWIKMPLGREDGLDPGDIVLDGDPAPLPQRHIAPIFGPCLLWSNGRPSQLLLCTYWNSSTFGKVMWKSRLPQEPCAAGHCPAERWITRLRSDVWRAATVVTTSRYDWYSLLTLTVWSANIRLVWCQPVVTRQLMSSVTVPEMKLGLWVTVTESAMLVGSGHGSVCQVTGQAPCNEAKTRNPLKFAGVP